MGLENNKCEVCRGKGWDDSDGDGRPLDCTACKGTGKRQKPALAVVPAEQGAVSKEVESPRYRPPAGLFPPDLFPSNVKEEKSPAPLKTPEPITLSAYSSESRANAVYPNRGTPYGLAYAGLGIAGESGEVADKIKKVLRDHAGELSPEHREAIALELGDALWYIDAVAFECGITLEEVGRKNLAKLADRRARKVIHGEGDNR